MSTCIYQNIGRPHGVLLVGDLRGKGRVSEDRRIAVCLISRNKCTGTQLPMHMEAYQVVVPSLLDSVLWIHVSETLPSPPS